MKKLFIGILVAAIQISATIAFGAVKENQFSFSPVAGGYTFDGKQNIKNSLVYGVRGGYNFTEHISVEALLDYVNSERTNTKVNVDVFRYGGELQYNFMPDKKLVPYLAAGVAGLTIVTQNQNRRPRWAFDYGAGLKYFLTDSLIIRGDVRHIFYNNYNSSNYNNLEYTAGVMIPFGGKERTIKPVEPPAATSSTASESQFKAASPADVSTRAIPANRGDSPKTPPAVAEDSSQKDSAVNPCKPIAINIRFDFDKSVIKPEFQSDLKAAGDFLKEFSASNGVIEGHTDSIGTKAYNLKLSLRRAESVRKYINSNFGIATERLTIKGYGEDRPADTNATKSGRAINRRVDASFGCQ